MPLGLIDVLKVAGFDPTLETRLVRHQDSRYSMEDLRRHKWNGQTWLELYQSYQSKPKFHKAKQIVSFYGSSGTNARFYGVYKVLDCLAATQGPGVPPSQKFSDGAQYFYRLKRDPRFDDLQDRLIVHWGRGRAMQSWVQKTRNKEVLEILAPGRKLPPFVDYLEFNLTHNELKDLFKSEQAHADWRVPLSNVAGVYLILAETSGHLYVGSAYGVGGLWGRWKEYARTGHGGNVRLKELMKGNPSYPESFRFSILQILPKSTAKEEVINWEKQYKRKLGKLATALNPN